MQRAITYALSVTLALWLGGLVSLFVFVSTLFKQSRELGVSAAPTLFGAFERLELFIAPLCIVLALLWRPASKPAKRVLLATLIAAALFAAAQIFVLTPKINELRLAGQSATDAFRQAHGQSMFLYVGTAVLTLLANLSLITGLLRQRVKVEAI